jgi:hypothetical protein
LEARNPPETNSRQDGDDGAGVATTLNAELGDDRITDVVGATLESLPPEAIGSSGSSALLSEQ